MAMRVETNPLEAAYAALLSHGLDGAGEPEFGRHCMCWSSVRTRRRRGRPEGRGFVGRSGRMLHNLLVEHGLRLAVILRAERT